MHKNTDQLKQVAPRSYISFKSKFHIFNMMSLYHKPSRATQWDVSQTEILQENHYYPFGLQMQGAWTNTLNSPENHYQYNGKEMNADLGLEWLDYGARWYDASIARWGAVDPLAETYNSFSPFVFVANNPNIFVDPNGESFYYASDGTFLGEVDDGKDDVHYWKEGQKQRIYEEDGKFSDSFSSGSFEVLSHKGKNISHNTFLGFASMIARESGGDKKESFGIASATINYLNEGGSSFINTLEDIALYSNGFASGSQQSIFTKYLDSKIKNTEFEIEAAINALTGGHDYSDGATSWDGIDLVDTKVKNDHRNWSWTSESKAILLDYKKQRNGGVKVSNWKYVNKNAQIRAIKILGKTVFTETLTGRGEGRGKKKFKAK